jgi:hypothetical protein
MIHFIITGDALSAGTEMMDADVFPNYNLLLEQFRGKELNERRIYRWRLQAQWGLKHFKTGAQRKSLDDGSFIRSVVNCYVRREKTLSWPAQLPNHYRDQSVRVTNLAQKGASFKRSCLMFDRFIRYNSDKGTRIAIHQLPDIRRTYFKHHGKILRVVDPYHLATLNFIKNPLEDETNLRAVALDRYRAVEERDKKSGYFLRVFEKQLNIVERLAYANNIKNFYICEDPAQAQLIDPDRIIIPNFKMVRQAIAYPRGLTDNIISRAYNEMVCEAIKKKLKLLI